MSDPIIPTPQDTQLVLQDTVTKTASFTSAGKDLGSGYAPGGLGQAVAAVVQVTALDAADGNETYVFALHESDDNLVYAPAGDSAEALATGTVAVKARIKSRYVRLVLTAGGTTPSITYKAWLNPLP